MTSDEIATYISTVHHRTWSALEHSVGRQTIFFQLFCSLVPDLFISKTSWAKDVPLIVSTSILRPIFALCKAISINEIYVLSD